MYASIKYQTEGSAWKYFKHYTLNLLYTRVFRPEKCDDTCCSQDLVRIIQFPMNLECYVICVSLTICILRKWYKKILL